MKQKAQDALTAFKELYQRAYNDSPHSQGSEAFALGIDTSSVNNYLRIDCDRHLPAGLVPHSIFAPQLLEFLAEQSHGIFVPVSGKIHANDREELRAILHAVSDLINEDDKTERMKLFKRIERLAARAICEDQQ